jgi:hypothetical protein
MLLKLITLLLQMEQEADLLRCVLLGFPTRFPRADCSERKSGMVVQWFC